jgi:hypothetical protein
MNNHDAGVTHGSIARNAADRVAGSLARIDARGRINAECRMTNGEPSERLQICLSAFRIRHFDVQVRRFSPSCQRL